MKNIDEIDWNQINPYIYLYAAELITSHDDFNNKDKELYACHAITRVLGLKDKNADSIYIDIFALYFRDNTWGAWLDISGYMTDRAVYFDGEEPSNQTMADNKILALLLMHQIAKEETAKFVTLKK